MNAVLLSSKNMCWCTPQDFFDKLNAEFGFVLDPAATDKTAKGAIARTQRDTREAPSPLKPSLILRNRRKRTIAL